MSEFKVGDWVTVKGTLASDIFKLTDKEVEHKEILLAHFRFGEETWSHWQPKVGEWCWFYNTGEGKPFCGKFVTAIQRNNSILYRAHNAWHECEYCEPFIGELPSWIKEIEK